MIGSDTETSVTVESWQTTDDGLPVFHTRYGPPVPKTWCTRRQLRAKGLSTAGLKPVGLLKNSYNVYADLFDPAGARPVRALTERQQAALAAGRQRLYEQRFCETCTECGKLVDSYQMCETDTATCCPDCVPKVMDREAREHQAMLDADRAEAAAWAATVLADPTAVALDTETTSLDGFAVEIAVVEVASGTVLFDRRLNPGEPISEGARQIHGISDADVADCPSFAAVAGELAAVLRGRRVVIYNADFDLGVLAREARRASAADQTRETLWAELRGINAECAMMHRSAWVGNWHDYWKNYTWVPLGGGHDAQGDCLAVIERIREMAADWRDTAVKD